MVAGLSTQGFMAWREGIDQRMVLVRSPGDGIYHEADPDGGFLWLCVALPAGRASEADHRGTLVVVAGLGPVVGGLGPQRSVSCGRVRLALVGGGRRHGRSHPPPR